MPGTSVDLLDDFKDGVTSRTTIARNEESLPMIPRRELEIRIPQIPGKHFFGCC